MPTTVATTNLLSVKDLGRAVRQARTAMKLRQAEAALLCGVGVRFLSDLERGKETVRLGPVLKVIQGLGLALMLCPKKPFWTQDGGHA
jgi:y4mF family transcriptional regulator